MFVVELSLKLSPMPVAVQRKEQAAADALYHQVKQAMESGQPRLLELTCEKEESKRITLLTDRISADSQSFFQQHGFQFSKMIPMRLVFQDT